MSALDEMQARCYRLAVENADLREQAAGETNSDRFSDAWAEGMKLLDKEQIIELYRLAGRRWIKKTNRQKPN